MVKLRVIIRVHRIHIYGGISRNGVILTGVGPSLSVKYGLVQKVSVVSIVLEVNGRFRHCHHRVASR